MGFWGFGVLGFWGMLRPTGGAAYPRRLSSRLYASAARFAGVDTGGSSGNGVLDGEEGDGDDNHL